MGMQEGQGEKSFSDARGPQLDVRKGVQREAGDLGTPKPGEQVLGTPSVETFFGATYGGQRWPKPTGAPRKKL